MSVDAAERTLEQNKAVAREFVERIFINRDLDAIDELVTNDFAAAKTRSVGSRMGR